MEPDTVLAPLARLTVVVPVGPGDSLSPRLREQLTQLPPGAQVVVVECEAGPVRREQSAVAAVDAPAGPRWHALHSPAGRSLQQNAGAAAGDGQWLWFLHADAALAPETLPALARFVAEGRSALGYFDLRFLGDGPALMRLNSVGVWLRSRVLRLPFGDQGFVLPRSLFTAVGGFDPATNRGEDHQLVWRVRRAGAPVVAVGAPLYTSARRYAARGWAATTIRHVGETLRQAWRFSRTEQPR
ncbi:glycosyltransferase [Lysobacter sp. H21R4]|uniref:glycosyltransferase n=1 Tax=Lysobacter sp. H21R4 TaxID=2781021 RepID=UPI0018872659|nr:glycosyltransferase [Lysobacter sp. H21R4]QOY62518.1 glycosyltransferase [Lysobacter sp. H21R4]